MQHRPVLLAEVLKHMPRNRECLVVLDATFGAGGHSRAILRGLSFIFPDLQKGHLFFFILQWTVQAKNIHHNGNHISPQDWHAVLQSECLQKSLSPEL